MEPVEPTHYINKSVRTIVGSEKSGRLFNVIDTRMQAKHSTATAMSMSHGLLASNLKYQFIFKHRQM